MLKTFSNSRKSSPNRTPVKKQTKMQSLLDPSRLRPPPITSIGGNDTITSNTRMNLSLGVHLQQDLQDFENEEIEQVNKSPFQREASV